MNKFNAVCSGSAASTSDQKYAHERLNQMVSSDDRSGPLKRAGRLKSQAKKCGCALKRIGEDVSEKLNYTARYESWFHSKALRTLRKSTVTGRRRCFGSANTLRLCGTRCGVRLRTRVPKGAQDAPAGTQDMRITARAMGGSSIQGLGN